SALHFTGDGAARRFDLARIDAVRFKRLQAVLAEVQQRARRRKTLDAALMRATEFGFLRLHHGGLSLPPFSGFVATPRRTPPTARTIRTGTIIARRTRTAIVTIAALTVFAGVERTTILRHRIVLHDLAFEDPDLHADLPVGGVGLGETVIDVRA